MNQGPLWHHRGLITIWYIRNVGHARGNRELLFTCFIILWGFFFFKCLLLCGRWTAKCLRRRDLMHHNPVSTSGSRRNHFRCHHRGFPAALGWVTWGFWGEEGRWQFRENTDAFLPTSTAWLHLPLPPSLPAALPQDRKANRKALNYIETLWIGLQFDDLSEGSGFSSR